MSFFLIPFSLFTHPFDRGGEYTSDGVKNFKSGDYSKAHDSFSKAKEKFQDDPRADYNLGRSFQSLREYEKSLESYGKSSQSEDPKLKSKSLYNQGTIYQELGDRKRAGESYLQSIIEDKDQLLSKKRLEWMRKQQNQQNSPNKNPNQGGGEMFQNPMENPGYSDPQEKDQPKKNSPSQKEADRILDSLDQDKINKKYQQTQRDRKFFW